MERLLRHRPRRPGRHRPVTQHTDRFFGTVSLQPEGPIQACDNIRIMLITNIKESTDATESPENSCLCKWYSHTIHKLCSAGAPEDIDDHTQFMVVDGTILHKSSSNITDRSLSKFPCDHEFGLTFNNAALCRRSGVIDWMWMGALRS